MEQEPSREAWRLPQGSEVGSFTPPEIDTSVPHTARMYDYFLGGKDNFEADRRAAEQVLSAIPDLPETLQVNRQFLRRSVRYAVRRGILQFLDIGTGIPTAGNTHEVAQLVDPRARVAYVDHDPIVLAHARALMADKEYGRTTFVLADLRSPAEILGSPQVREVIDFDQPVVLMLVSILHFIKDEEDPYGLVTALCDGLAPGSLVVLSHASLDPDPETGLKGSEGWARASATMNMRTYDQILSFFDRLDLVEPGLTSAWNPDNEPNDLGFTPENVWGYAGVGRVR